VGIGGGFIRPRTSIDLPEANKFAAAVIGSPATMDQNVAQPHPEGIAESCEILAQSSRIVSHPLRPEGEGDTLGILGRRIKP
jgi:hypothetical protein